MSTRRSPEAIFRARAWVLALGLAGLAGTVLAAPPATKGERAHLLSAQQAMTERFDREVAACGERFLVTDCIDQVNRQRRIALAPVRDRLLQIDEAERLQRAEERRATLAAKQRIRAERMAGAQAAAQAQESASASRVRQRMLPPAAPLASSDPRVAAQAERQQQAAERALRAQRRQAEAAERQARVARRLAEREADKGAAQPLPTPAAPPAAAASR